MGYKFFKFYLSKSTNRCFLYYVPLVLSYLYRHSLCISNHVAS